MSRSTKKTSHKFNKFRLWSLTIAESFDAWRIVPRLMLIAYAALVMNMYGWYKSIPTYVQEHCDAAVIQILVMNKASIEDAQKAACSVQNVVGGPTPAQTALVTTIIGLASLIFGFYTNSGRRWDNGMPPDIVNPPFPPIPPPPMPPFVPQPPIPPYPPQPPYPPPIVCDPAPTPKPPT